MTYHVLYRGPLSSCNYACDYCPFAKRQESYAELEGDREGLARFLAWIAAHKECCFGVLFTPWGEALVRRWYQRALVELTHHDHVARAAIQTNLSSGLDWVEECRLDRLALWATYHPGEVDRHVFVSRVRNLHERGVRLSVGIVGLREHLDAVAAMRQELPAATYLWVNAYKRQADYYTPDEAEFLARIDPYFPINNQRYPSQGQPCGAGETSFTVDGDGVMRRCHFVGQPIGSIHDADWQRALRPRPCPNATCGCHIGYVHLKRLQQGVIYGDNLLERIPLTWPK